MTGIIIKSFEDIIHVIVLFIYVGVAAALGGKHGVRAETFFFSALDCTDDSHIHRLSVR